MEMSNLMVLQSAAGYYVGRQGSEENFYVPYSRESGYYKSKEEACKALVNGFTRRVAPENFHIYETKKHEYIEVTPGVYRSMIHSKLRMAAL
jgi:hypothetical protein